MNSDKFYQTIWLGMSFMVFIIFVALLTYASVEKARHEVNRPSLQVDCQNRGGIWVNLNRADENVCVWSDPKKTLDR